MRVKLIEYTLEENSDTYISTSYHFKKENITLFTLMTLIVLSFVLMRFQYNSTTKNQDSLSRTNKAKTNSINQTEIPRFLPAL